MKSGKTLFITRWFLNRTFFTKLLLIFSLLIIITVCIGLTGILGSSRISNLLNSVIDHNLLPVIYLFEIKKELLDFELQVHSALLSNSPEEITYAKGVLIQNTSKMLKFYSDQLENLNSTAIAGATHNPTKIKEFIDLWPDYIDKYEQTLSLALAKDQISAIQKLNDEAKPLKYLTHSIIDESINYYRTNSVNTKETAEQFYSETRYSLLFSVAIAVLLSFTISYFLARFFGAQLKKVANAATEIADGNLSSARADEVNIRGKDELGQLGMAFSHMILTLQNILSSTSEVASVMVDYSSLLNNNTQQTLEGSAQVAEVSHGINTGAIQQNRKIETMVESLEELMLFTDMLLEKTDSMLKVSSEASSRASMGKKSALLIMDKMRSIKSLMDHNLATVKQLDGVSIEIEHVLQVVEEVADQTNLLSLNASIEAARAGADGEGFGVIANSIKKLSSRTQRLLHEVRTLTEDSRAGIGEVISAISSGTNEAVEGNKLVDELEGTFISISDYAKEVVDHVETITAFISDLSGKGRRILSSMQEVSAIANDYLNDTSILSDSSFRLKNISTELAGLSTEMHKNGDLLLQNISHFKIR